MLIHAFISSWLDCCDSLFTCLNKSALSYLQTVQNAVARLLTRTKRISHITPILHSLNLLPVQLKIKFKILVLKFRVFPGKGSTVANRSGTPLFN